MLNRFVMISIVLHASLFLVPFSLPERVEPVKKEPLQITFKTPIIKGFPPTPGAKAETFIPDDSCPWEPPKAINTGYKPVSMKSEQWVVIITALRDVETDNPEIVEYTDFPEFSTRGACIKKVFEVSILMYQYGGAPFKAKCIEKSKLI